MRIPEITVAQMAKVDKLMVKDYNISVLQMMENAGRILANLVLEHHPKKVCILVGKGNNGGGGLVAARYLHNHGVKVSIVLAQKALKTIPKSHLKTVQKLKIPILKKIPKCDLIVDALLGYNSKGELRGNVKRIVIEANLSGIPIISLDVPTGYNLQRGKYGKLHINPNKILTIGLPKKGMKKLKGLYYADIGIPREIYKKLKLKTPNFLHSHRYREC